MLIYHSLPEICDKAFLVRHTCMCCMTAIYCNKVLNLLQPSDAIWRHRSRSTLVRVMASCLMAPSHYLHQCWILVSKVLWYLPESNFASSVQDKSLYDESRNCTLKFIATSYRDPWVNHKDPCWPVVSGGHRSSLKPQGGSSGGAVLFGVPQ